MPELSRRLFWDVDLDQPDPEAPVAFIIERAFWRGDVPDIRNCRRHYGDECITKVLLDAKFLPLDALHLAGAIFDKPLEAFRCYTLRQSNPGLFPY